MKKEEENQEQKKKTGNVNERRIKDAAAAASFDFDGLKDFYQYQSRISAYSLLYATYRCCENARCIITKETQERETGKRERGGEKGRLMTY